MKFYIFNIESSNDYGYSFSIHKTKDREEFLLSLLNKNHSKIDATKDNFDATLFTFDEFKKNHPSSCSRSNLEDAINKAKEISHRSIKKGEFKRVVFVLATNDKKNVTGVWFVKGNRSEKLNIGFFNPQDENADINHTSNKQLTITPTIQVNIGNNHPVHQSSNQGLEIETENKAQEKTSSSKCLVS